MDGRCHLRQYGGSRTNAYPLIRGFMIRKTVLLLLPLLLCQTASASSGRRQLLQLQQLFHEVSQRVTPSVVHIETIQDLGKRRKKITGSGYVWDTKGHIVTNEHVVARAARIQVRFSGQKEPVTAVVVGTDPQTDLALLRVADTANFPKPLVAAKDGGAQVGDWVLAVGNPYGLDGSVSFGIISARSRNIGNLNAINPFLQTDAMIDFGSSGGPLVNLFGKVVGLNSMGQGRGIGFTIPIATVRKIVARLMKGPVKRGWLGVVVQPLPETLRHWWKLKKHGVVVNRVLPGSPAEGAGLHVGDVLSSLNQHPVDIREDKDLVEFRRLVADAGARSVVSLQFSRLEKSGWHLATTTITLDLSPPAEGKIFKSPLGFTVEELTVSAALQRGAAGLHGLLVLAIEPGTPASEAQLVRGDIIESINGNPVHEIQALQSVSSTDSLLLQNWRNGNRVFLLVEPLISNEQE